MTVTAPVHDQTGTGNDHTWIGAAEIRLDPRLARRAARLGSVSMDAFSRSRADGLELPPDDLPPIRVLDVYCSVCKAPFGVSRPCQSGFHLRGGPPGRRRRKAGDPAPSAP